jgi:hypothetical protein
LPAARVDFGDHEREGEGTEAAITRGAPSFGAFRAGLFELGTGSLAGQRR